MNTKAFTLIETLVAVFIFTMLAVGMATLFIQVFSNPKQAALSLGTSDQARKVEFVFVNEMRNATEGVDGSYAINQAGDNQIIFYSTYDSGTTTIDRVRYYVASSTLYRGIVTPAGSPLAYNLASEISTAVQTNLASTSVPIFTYYNGSYAGTSTPMIQPINVNQVKFVQINLVVLKQDQRNSTTTFALSTGASIRGVKTNLGS